MVKDDDVDEDDALASMLLRHVISRDDPHEVRHGDAHIVETQTSCQGRDGVCASSQLPKALSSAQAVLHGAYKH